VKIAVLILTSPIQFQNSDTAIKFIEAAADKGHEVTVMAIGDGVYNDLKQVLSSEVPLPSIRIKELVEKKGVKFINCFPCITARGLKPEDFMLGSTVEGTSTIVDIISEADRTIAFTM
jgi:sulfur relay (sulfurtransferase) complex TusBCD TusD component (DsrE family)